MAAGNPFPGMNPYLENRWGDVHASLITYARDALQSLLPNDLRARMQERVFVESAERVERLISPDVHVYQNLGARKPAATSQAGSIGTIVLDEPLVVRVPETQLVESWLQIVDARTGGKVITIIEVLSRSNKVAGPGRDLYLRKQTEALQSGVNLVEIDLIRGGEPTTLTPPHLIPMEQREAYHVSVFRGARPLEREYYAAALRRSLPRVAIPLRDVDGDIAMDLQSLLNECYARGRHDDIDYRAPAQPPLDADDAAWADALLRSQRLR